MWVYCVEGRSMTPTLNPQARICDQLPLEVDPFLVLQIETLFVLSCWLFETPLKADACFIV